MGPAEAGGTVQQALSPGAGVQQEQCVAEAGHLHHSLQVLLPHCLAVVSALGVPCGVLAVLKSSQQGFDVFGSAL